MSHVVINHWNLGFKGAPRGASGEVSPPPSTRTVCRTELPKSAWWSESSPSAFKSQLSSLALRFWLGRSRRGAAMCNFHKRLPCSRWPARTRSPQARTADSWTLSSWFHTASTVRAASLWECAFSPLSASLWERALTLQCLKLLAGSKTHICR